MLKTITVISISLLLIFFSVSDSHAQSDANIPEFRGRGGFQNYLKYMIANDPYIYSRHCSKFISLVKFKIDENGHIDSINVSSNTSPYMRLLIRKMMYTTDGQWNPVVKNGKAVMSNYIFLPIYFYLEAGCGIDESAISLSDSVSQVNSHLDYHRKIPEIINLENPVMESIKINIWPPCWDLGDVMKHREKNKKEPK